MSPFNRARSVRPHLVGLQSANEMPPDSFCMAECNMLPNVSQKIRQEWKHSIISEFCPSRSIPLKHGWQWCESKFPSIFIHIFENKKNSETKWVFPQIGVPQNGWFIRENPIKMDDLGVPLFLETSKYTPRGSNTTALDRVWCYTPFQPDGVWQHFSFVQQLLHIVFSKIHLAMVLFKQKQHWLLKIRTHFNLDICIHLKSRIKYLLTKNPTGLDWTPEIHGFFWYEKNLWEKSRHTCPAMWASLITSAGMNLDTATKRTLDTVGWLPAARIRDLTLKHQRQEMFY